MNFTFNSSGKIWNCSLNLSFLHPHATISSNNSNTTTSVRIPLVDSTVRNNLCHPSFESNVKYKSITQLHNLRGNITLVFWHSDRQEWWSGSDRHACLPLKHDSWPAAKWKQYGSVVRGGVWWVWADYQKIFGNIRTYALNYHNKH